MHIGKLEIFIHNLITHKTMVNKFTIYTSKGTTHTVGMRFKENVANIGYGFNSRFSQGTEKLPGAINNVRYHNSITPFTITKMVHIKSGRTFTLGKVEGFIHYTIPMLENGKPVATIAWEDYYKD